jgi:HK97 family phage prohead protease
MDLVRRYHDGAGLEIRAGRQVTGKITYRRKGMLSDGQNRGGRPLGEVIEPGAFNFRIATPSHDGKPKNIHLLKSHDYAEPLASTRAGSLSFTDTATALIFRAVIASTRAGDDAIELIRSGVAPGVSFGFRLPPKRRVAVAATMEREPFQLGDVAFDPTDGAPPADHRRRT